MITIVIAEDHHIVRQGLRLLLQTESDFRLAGEAADGQQALHLVMKLQPNVLLLDLMIPKVHGLEVIRHLKAQEIDTRILILSMHADPAYITEALRYGASGYVLKNSTGAHLVKAVRAVAAGQRYLSPAISPRSIRLGRRSQPPDPLDHLSSRQRVVLQLLAEGLNTHEVAERLTISPRTVETHRANLMHKLNLRSQVELVHFAIRKKLISL